MEYPKSSKRLQVHYPAEENEAIVAAIPIQQNLLEIYNPLAKIDLWNKKGNIMVIGLRGAGKCTFMNMLKQKLHQMQPLQHPPTGLLEIKGIKIKCFDVAANDGPSMVGADYYNDVDGIIFIVDASESTHEAAKSVLDEYIGDESLHGPILVVGNKVDKPDAVSQQELCHRMGILDNERPSLEAFMCSATNGFGYLDALDWLSANLPDA